MIERIVRAIRLDWTVFREIAEDQHAMQEAAIIVVIVTFLSAVGSGIAASSFLVGFLVSWLVEILVFWIGWAVITYFVGTALFKGKTDIPEMMRVLGYAKAPVLLGIFRFIPCVGWIIALAGWILSLIAGVLAVREAMDFDTGNAIITVVISWVVALIVYLIIVLPLTGMAFGIG
jgi:hypothetical protein